MNFASVRIITGDISRLVGFYETALGAAATWFTPDFAEVTTPGATLAIGSDRTVALFGAGAARPAANASVIVEFQTDDVDAVYQERRDALGEVVQTPTTMPWGNRS